KFTDHHLIAPACLKGLEFLSKSAAMKRETVIYIVRCIYKDLTVQTLVQNDRYLVYMILQNFVEHRSSDLEEMNDGEFVLGFTQAVDSERDPRNLLTIFKLVSLIGRRFKLGVVAEDLFEVIACYFPIDFKPKISRDELSTSLKTCFSSTTEFADYALPLFIEKLQSTNSQSKNDSLDYFTDCCQVYHPAKISKYSSGFWDSIKRDVRKLLLFFLLLLLSFLFYDQI
ncbi:hypothetical protein HELRODRAFT_69243, partial [Helobdella robusta]|uniref:MMS19 nucleotide excision repair protein n=1 Tax=Helobdella robusta TaxID=6412 RepID=T1FZR7_HELRO